MKVIDSERVKEEILHFFKTKSRKEVVQVSVNTYIYKGFRFTFIRGTLDIRYIKYDKEDFFKVYEFEKSKSVKGYFFKTTLLLHRRIDQFCSLSLNEFENRG